MARFVLSDPLRMLLTDIDGAVDAVEPDELQDIEGFELGPLTYELRMPRPRTQYQVAAAAPAAPVTFVQAEGWTTTVGPMIAGVEIFIGSHPTALPLALEVLEWMRANGFARPRIQRRLFPWEVWT